MPKEIFHMLIKYSLEVGKLLIFFSILFNIQGLTANTLDVTDLELKPHKVPLPISHRLAFMSGHVEVGIELYRLNELKMASPHLLHPVTETHKAEREGLEELGFNTKVFEKVSNSLDQNQPATEIDLLLKQASNNLSDIADKLGGDQRKIIRFLLAITVEEYDLSFNNNQITNIGEYQDSWGFVKVAIQHAKKITNIKLSRKITKKLKILHGYWINGPLPVDRPIKPITIKNAIQNILDDL